MRHYQYRTKGTCSTLIDLDLEGNIVHNVVFTGGCNGNLKAIPILVEGMSVDEIERKLKDVKCGFRDTSCAGQLAIAVRKAYEKEMARV